MVNPASNVSAQKFKNTTPAEQTEAINQKDLLRAPTLRQMKAELVNWIETPKDTSFTLNFKMSTSALWRASLCSHAEVANEFSFPDASNCTVQWEFVMRVVRLLLLILSFTMQRRITSFCTQLDLRCFENNT